MMDNHTKQTHKMHDAPDRKMPKAKERPEQPKMKPGEHAPPMDMPKGHKG